MRKVLYRQVNTCTAPGTAFYRCSKGPFVGCCSVDPCTTGICPDQDGGTNSVEASASPVPAAVTSHTSASTSTSTTRQVSTSNADIPSSVIQDTATGSVISQPSSSTLVSSSTFQSTVDATHTISTSSTDFHTGTTSVGRSNINSARAGVIAAGVSALFVIIAILFGCICWRRRKNDGKRFVIRKMKPEGSKTHEPNDAQHSEETPTSSNCPFEEFGGHYYAKPQVKDSNSPDTLTTASTIPDYQPPMTKVAGELPGFIPRRADITPELSDVSSLRLRAELSSNPERHLINIPYTQRRTGTRVSSARSHTAPSSALPSVPQTITTPDGIILSSNMGSIIQPSAKCHQTQVQAQPSAEKSMRTVAPSRKQSDRGHVLSFMNYESQSNKTSISAASIQRQPNVKPVHTTAPVAKTMPNRPLPGYTKQNQLHRVMNVRIPPGSSKGHHDGDQQAETELPA